MYVDAWILFALFFFALGMAWSSVARGRTINCLMGCYWDLLNTVSDAHNKALLDIADGRDLDAVGRDLERAVSERLPLHKKALARTGERFPHPSSVSRFEQELRS